MAVVKEGAVAAKKKTYKDGAGASWYPSERCRASEVAS
jgi:hypothetical protein